MFEGGFLLLRPPEVPEGPSFLAAWRSSPPGGRKEVAQRQTVLAPPPTSRPK